ncbi:MAG: low molecular weight phosphotyrosine protein phosphatase [Oscillospiraceae bacterium]|nr:low molecular weight phosphotyrosine protein phosphatase [Oscillospiraceae bacterium]
MTRILFVCLGNICRSPMAEFIMKDLVEKKGLSNAFYIESAATCSDEVGNPVYPPVRKLLAERGISTVGKTARKITKADYDRFDYIVGMDRNNLSSMLRQFGGDPENKLSLLMDHTGDCRDVADPWYTRDFHATERDVDRGCAALLEKIL